LENEPAVRAKTKEETGESLRAGAHVGLNPGSKKEATETGSYVIFKKRQEKRQTMPPQNGGGRKKKTTEDS